MQVASITAEQRALRPYVRSRVLLRVDLLLHDGRATARGRQFISKYPKSLYRPAVEAALQGAVE